MGYATIRDNAVQIFSRIDVWAESAALAFYALLSMAPLLLLFFSLMSWIGWETEAAFVQQAHQLVGPYAADAIHQLLTQLKSEQKWAAGSGVVGIAALLFSASVVFGQLKKVMYLIFVAEAAPQTIGMVRSFLMEKFFSIGIVVAFIFLTACSLLLSSLLSLLNLERLIYPEVLHQVVNLVLYTILFFLVFKIIPRRYLRTSAAMKGGLLTAVLFVIGKGLIGLYIGNSVPASAFGAAGAFVVFLVWMYYAALVVFASAILVKSWVG